jgi:predicted O-linked N-acetylglucosamine transferase (SPINDLY family)
MTTEASPLNFDSKEVLKAYQTQQFEKVTEAIIGVLKHFEKTVYVSCSDELQAQIDDIVSTIFYVLVRPDFAVPSKYAPLLITMSHLFANLVGMSSYNTTDSIIGHLLKQKGNLIKLLMSYTCYNKDIINPQKLFDAQPVLASMWWQNYQTAPAGSLTQQMHHNMTSQLKKIPNEFILTQAQVAPLYFQATYYTENSDARPIKEMFNREIKKLAQVQRPIKNYPSKNKIAIITDRWQPTTAVYKSLYPMVAALKDKYELTLIHFNENKATDTSIFKNVKRVSMKQDFKSMDLRSIELNTYALAFFPDIGMNTESVYLSNIRLAPIMVTGYGHPVSTFGSEIDYFIGGQESENIEWASKNYSERLVLIPGIGATPVDPKYTRTNPERDKFIINCCWTSTKINYPMLTLLREVALEAKKEVHFSFFPSWTVGRYNNAIPLQKYLKDYVPNATIYLDKKYHEYLNIMEKGSLTLDPHPFGGYNTVVDSLFVGLPVVTIEGNQFYNKSAAALLRRVGLNKLITDTKEDCKNLILQLIHNPALLEKYTKILEPVEFLEQRLLDAPEPPGFLRAIDYLIENHMTLKKDSSNQPIIIN